MAKILSTLLFLIIFNSEALATEQPLEIKPLTDDVYQYVSYFDIEPWGLVGASGLIVIKGSDAYLIDTPWTAADTQKVLEWFKSKKLHLKAAIATHFHEDASGGVALLNQLNIPTYATSLTNELLINTGREAASHSIDSDAFQLVENAIEVFYPGPGHSQDNIVVWLPKEKVLFGGCLVRNHQTNSLGNTADASIKDWANSVEHILTRFAEIKHVIPGHGQSGGVELLQHTISLATQAKQKLAK